MRACKEKTWKTDVKCRNYAVGTGARFVDLKERGAALLMQDQGTLVEVDAQSVFEAYAKRHGKRWITFLAQLGLDLKSTSDDNSLVLVRGFVKTTGWDIGSFTSRSHRRSARLHAVAANAVDIHVSLTKQQRVLREPEWHSGPATPSIRNLVGIKKFDQCVFVLGVKCRETSVLSSIKISAVP